jgi:hypothetical protein
MSVKDNLSSIISEYKKRKDKSYLFCREADKHELYKTIENGENVYRCKHCGKYWSNKLSYVNDLVEESKVTDIPIIKLACQKRYKSEKTLPDTMYYFVSFGEFSSLDYFQIEVASFDDTIVTYKILSDKPLAIKGEETLPVEATVKFDEELCFYIPSESFVPPIEWIVSFSKIPLEWK